MKRQERDRGIYSWLPWSVKATSEHFFLCFYHCIPDSSIWHFEFIDMISILNYSRTRSADQKPKLNILQVYLVKGEFIYKLLWEWEMGFIFFTLWPCVLYYGPQGLNGSELYFTPNVLRLLLPFFILWKEKETEMTSNTQHTHWPNKIFKILKIKYHKINCKIWYVSQTTPHCL